MKFTSPLLIIFILSISGCNLQRNPDGTMSAAGGKATQPSPAKPASYTKEAKLIAVGDILMHTALTRSGYNPQKKTYVFDGFFKEVKDIISTGD